MMMTTLLNTHLRNLSQADWQAYGLNDLAYLRPAVVDGRQVYAIYAADGAQVAVAATREIGMAAILQYDLEPVTLH